MMMQGFNKYCRNRCCRGRSSCGCMRITGSNVTQPKRIEQTSQRTRICGSSSSRRTQAQRGPEFASGSTMGATASGSNAGRPRNVGPGPPHGPAPAPGCDCWTCSSLGGHGSTLPLPGTTIASGSASTSDSSWLGWYTSERTHKVTSAFVSSSCIMPTSAVTWFTATIAAPGCTRSGGRAAGTVASWPFAASSPPAAPMTSSAISCNCPRPRSARWFHRSNNDPGLMSSTSRHSRPSELGRKPRPYSWAPRRWGSFSRRTWIYRAFSFSVPSFGCLSACRRRVYIVAAVWAQAPQMSSSTAAR
mmetsp:Transcript_16467/g.49168  ORF Transcript_16467/g.49168 Transcript_16467/m.49168 type:complete len:303 (-) Transcript_16467:416-1324(-)